MLATAASWVVGSAKKGATVRVFNGTHGQGLRTRRQTRKAVRMASQDACGKLNQFIREAIAHRRWQGTNDNPALGKAVMLVETWLLPWARRELKAEADQLVADAENLMADVGCKAIRQFHRFHGTTGGEFFRWMQRIAARAISRLKRRREARDRGLLRRGKSLERAAEDARLIELIQSPEAPPEEVAMMHENTARVQRALRGLSADQRRVVRLRTDDYSFRDIAVVLHRSATSVHEVWEAAAHYLRTRLASSATRAKRAAVRVA